MTRFRVALLLAAIAACALLGIAQQKPQAAAKPQPAPMKASADFERLKTLVGRWEGQGPEGQVFSTFRLTADGSAIMNFLFPDTPHEMLTVFHPDGANLMGTHYCSGHNQPRFVATPSPDPKVLTFKFKDITNLATPEAGHIEGVVITFVDADHHIEEWVGRENGKESKMSVEFTRKQ